MLTPFEFGRFIKLAAGPVGMPAMPKAPQAGMQMGASLASAAKPMLPKLAPPKPAATPAPAQPTANYAAEKAYRNNASARTMAQFGSAQPIPKADPSAWAGLSQARMKEIDREIPAGLMQQYGARDQQHLMDILGGQQ